MGRYVGPLPCDEATRGALFKGYLSCRDPRRQRHWQGLLLLTGQSLDDHQKGLHRDDLAELAGVSQEKLFDQDERLGFDPDKLALALRRAGASSKRIRKLEGPLTISDVARVVGLTEGAVRHLIKEFQQEGLAYLQRPYGQQRPGRKGGQRRALAAEQLHLLSLNRDVLEGTLADIQVWVKAQTGKPISPATASRLRARAKRLRT